MLMLLLLNLVNRTGVTGNSWPHICALFGDWSGDGGSLHFTLVVDNYSSVVLEVNGGTILSVKRFTFLDGGHDHISDGGGWHSVQSTLVTNNGDNVQVLGTGVVGAVHDGGNWKGERDMEFASQRTSSSSLRHFYVVFLVTFL